MTPALTYQNLPVFGTAGTLVKPVAGTYDGGFLPGQLFPAEYENWLMNYITANSSFSQTGVSSMVAELNNILAAASIAPNAGISTQVLTALQTLFLGIGAQAADSAKLDGLSPASYALLASPTFTGTPAAPTPSSSDNSTKIATTAFVVTALANAPISSLSHQEFNGNTGTVQISSMVVGEMRFVSIAAGGSLTTLIAPAVGTFLALQQVASRSNPFSAGATIAQGTGFNFSTIIIRTA